MNKKKHLYGLMDSYAKPINILNPADAMYIAKFDGLVKFCNELVMEIPQKLDDALEDTDKRNTSSTMHHFVQLYGIMMKRFKIELKKLKECKAKCVI